MRHLIRRRCCWSVLALAGCTAATGAVAACRCHGCARADRRRRYGDRRRRRRLCRLNRRAGGDHCARGVGRQAPGAQVAWADVATVDGDYFVRGNLDGADPPDRFLRLSLWGLPLARVAGRAGIIRSLCRKRRGATGVSSSSTMAIPRPAHRAAR